MWQIGSEHDGKADGPGDLLGGGQGGLQGTHRLQTSSSGSRTGAEHTQIRGDDRLNQHRLGNQLAAH